MIETLACHCGKRYRAKPLADGTFRDHACPYCGLCYQQPDADVVHRYLVLVDGQIADLDFDTEAEAVKRADRFIEVYTELFPNRHDSTHVEVVRSVRRWELDAETGERTIRWWCTRDQKFCNLQMTAPVTPDWLKPHLQVRRFTDKPFLRRKVDWTSWHWCLSHLPRRKAAGTDGITYEMVRDAPLALQGVIFDALNDMLLTGNIPRDMKGGLVRLLTKREPVSQLENLRPVTLLQITYKLFTSLLNSRLQREI